MEMGLVELMGAGWLSKSISVAARLGIADLLEQGPLSHQEIAQATRSHPEVLWRMLRLLAACEIFELCEDGRFRNSPLSEQLQSGHRMSLRYFCMLAGEEYYDGWGKLLYSVTTGEPAFPQVFGSSIYEYMESNPEAGRVYDRAMQELARPVGMLLAKSYNFASVRRIVDVGGGNGALLRQILSLYKDLHGVCFDRPSVCIRGREDLQFAADQTLRARLSFQPGNFFEDVPADADVYILKNTLHNWNDEGCRAILGTVARAMRTTTVTTTKDGRARLLVLEPLVEPEDTSPRNLMDAMFQIVICQKDTRERSAAQLRALIATADLQVLDIQVLPSGHGVVECVPQSS